jgi:hypothetical protein
MTTSAELPKGLLGLSSPRGFLCTECLLASDSAPTLLERLDDPREEDVPIFQHDTWFGGAMCDGCHELIERASSVGAGG